LRLRSSTKSTVAFLTALVFMLSMVCSCFLIVPTAAAFEDEPAIASDVSEPESILEGDEGDGDKGEAPGDAIDGTGTQPDPFDEGEVNFPGDSIGDDTQIDPLEEDQGLIDDPLGEQITFRNGISVFGGSGDSALYGKDTLLASTLLGGERSECINDLVIGLEGKVYVAGVTKSPDFPKTAGSYVYDSKPHASNQHAFVAILDADLQSVIACTSFNGDPVSGSNTATAIALDDEGYVYITGYTSNMNGFPTTPGAYQEQFNGTQQVDNFVTKFKPDLSGIVASTLIGGSGEEYSYDIALDSNKNIYIAGQAKRTSPDYPTDEDDPFRGKTNNMAIVSKFNNDLTELLASRVVETRTARVLTVDQDNNVYVAGQENNPRGLWVAKLGDDLKEKAKKKVGLANENVGGIVVDESGNIYVTGGAGTNYPVTEGAYQTTPIGNNAYITKLSNNLEVISSTTFGSGGQQGKDLALDSEGNIYVLVGSSSGTIPTTPGAYADQPKGDYELGIAKFDSNLSELIASTYFGGSGKDGSGDAAIALDDRNNIFIASGTMSIDRALQEGIPITPLDFPLTDNAFQEEVAVRYTNIGGGTTGFISKFQAPPNWNTNVYTFALDEQVKPAAINSETYTIDVTVKNGTDLTSLVPEITLSPGATISPAFGQAVDFSTSEDNPVAYTVIAENGTNQQQWNVIVRESGVPVMEQALITRAGGIKLVFDIEIAELPAEAAEQFAVTVNGEPVSIGSIEKTENDREIILTLGSKIGSGAAVNLAFTKAEEETIQVKSTLEKALESFETDSFLKEPPALQSDTEGKRIGQEVVITFDNDAAWRNAITGITVNDQEITTQQYSMTDGSIAIDATVFTAAGDYNIKVLAAGYGCSELIQTMEAPQPFGIKAAEVTLKGDIMLVFDKQIVLPEKDSVADQFTVKVNGSKVSVSSITVGYSGDRVTLALAEKVQGGQTVTIGYTRSEDDSLHIKSNYGETLENFTEQPVINTLPEEPEAPEGRHPQLAAGSSHTLVVNNGEIWATGYNASGQLGDGTKENRVAPVKVQDLDKIIAVAASSEHNMALQEGGTVWAWGRNRNGRLGDGTTTDSSIPVQVKDLTDIIAIAAGSEHSIALKDDGTVWAWGRNRDKQLGNENVSDQSTVPVQVADLKGIIQINSGKAHNIALKNDGSVWGWGSNSKGQLGNGANSQPIPVKIQAMDKIVSVSAGAEHTIALKEEGTILALGYNFYGQLGDGTNTASSSPKAVNIDGIMEIAVGDNHCIAFKNDNTLWAWGRNNNGQLGNGTTTDSNIPVWVYKALSPRMVVATTNPAKDAQNVNIDSNIEITFSKNVDLSTVENKVILTRAEEPEKPLGVTITCESNKLVITPEQKLDYDIGYTVTVKKGIAEEGTPSNTLESDENWNFTTERLILITYPYAWPPDEPVGGIYLDNNTFIVRFFKSINPASFAQPNAIVLNKIGTLGNPQGEQVFVPFSYGLDNDKNSLEITTNENLEYGTYYELILPAGIKDSEGNATVKDTKVVFYTVSMVSEYQICQNGEPVTAVKPDQTYDLNATITNRSDKTENATVILQVRGGKGAREEQGGYVVGQPYRTEVTVESGASVEVSMTFYTDPETIEPAWKDDIYGDIMVLDVDKISCPKAVTGHFTFPIDNSELTCPELQADPDAAVGQDVVITFPDDPTWRSALLTFSLTVDGVTLGKDQYEVTEGKITINADVFTEAGDYVIVVEALGYEGATVTQTIISGDDSGGNGGGNGGGGGDGGGSGSGTPGGLKILSFNKVKLSSTDTLLQFDFGNGMDRTLESNLNHIKVYEKTIGNEVKWSDHNYIKQGSGDDAVKLRRLELMFDNLKAGTTYVVELGPEVEANNGSTLGVTRKFEFTTTGTSTGGGAGGSTVEQVIGKNGGAISEYGATIEIPAAALGQDVKINVEKVADISKLPLPEKSKFIGHVVEITKDKSENFKKAVTITLTFEKSKVDADKYDLNPCYLDEKASKWVPLDNVKVDLAAGKVSGETTHFTKFAIIATEKIREDEPKPVGPVIVLKDIAGHWAEKTIEELVASGAISGYPDGTFQPNKTITRAEFATILVKAFNLESKTGKVFNDTAGHWAKEAIATAQAHGIITGYSDTSFGPNDNITREQMAVMIVKAAQPAGTVEAPAFNDSSKIADWAQQAVAAASGNKIITGYPDNTFRPQAQATRAEAATVMVNALN
jgi:uncharacterized repeat protein (TIGR02059 family)